MNNSLVKLEDFQLDEISGGITESQKEILKKAGKYAIKGASRIAGCVVVTASVFAVIGFLNPETKEFKNAKGERIPVKNSRLSEAGEQGEVGALVGLIFALLSGLYEISGNLGNLVCKKIGLDD